MTNGLVNGIRNGITNGIVNGRGATNGVRLSYQHRKLGVEAVTFRNKLLMISALCVAVLLIPYVLVFTFPPDQVDIDGYFLDWVDAQIYVDVPDSENSDVSIVEYAMKQDARASYFYIRTDGQVFRGADDGADGFYLFIDIDGNSSTGYSVRGLGAESLALVIGWNHSLVLHETYFFDHRASPNDFAGFRLSGHPAVAFKGDKIEIGTNIVLAPESRAVACARHTNVSDDWSEANFVANGPAVRVVEEFCAVPVTSGDTDELMLKVHVFGKGPSVELTGLNFEMMGNVTPSIITAVESLRVLGDTDSSTMEFVKPLTLRQGLSTTIELLASFPEGVAGATFGLRLNRSAGLMFEGNATIAYDSTQTDSMVTHIMSPSPKITIDGAFADWKTRPTMEDDLGDAFSVDDANLTAPNIDITGVKTASQEETAYFYMAVDGSMMAGSNVPGDIVRVVAPDVVVGDITDTPITRSGMDFAYIFIDTDFNQSTGSATTGSEACIVVAGKRGQVLTSTAYLYEDSVWNAVGKTDAAADSKQLEVGCSYEVLGLSPEGIYAVTFLSQDWQGCEDQKFAFLSTRSPSGVKAIGGIIINEIYSSGPKTSDDWIELLNTGPVPIDLEGWTLYIDGRLVYTFDEPTIIDSWEFLVIVGLDFLKGTTFELRDDVEEPIDEVTVPRWLARSYGRVGTLEGGGWDWMDPTPGDWNEGQVPIPEFEGVLVPLAIVTIMFFAIRRKRREQTTEEDREGETDDSHE